MSKQVKISKLCLEIGGKKIDLTLKQAKELMEVLNETLGVEAHTHIMNIPIAQPYIPYTPNGIWYSSGQINESPVFNGNQFEGSISNNCMSLTAQ
jgi:hypothetical protein